LHESELDLGIYRSAGEDRKLGWLDMRPWDGFSEWLPRTLGRTELDRDDWRKPSVA